MRGLDLKEEHLRMVLRILRETVPRCEVWAFGSRATGNARPGSDLDIALRDTGLVPLTRLGALREAFEESSLPFFVDILDWNAMPESFRENIRRDRILLQEGAVASSDR